MKSLAPLIIFNAGLKIGFFSGAGGFSYPKHQFKAKKSFAYTYSVSYTCQMVVTQLITVHLDVSIC